MKSVLCSVHSMNRAKGQQIAEIMTEISVRATRLDVKDSLRIRFQSSPSSCNPFLVYDSLIVAQTSPSTSAISSFNVASETWINDFQRFYHFPVLGHTVFI